jgi:ABC-2 type transport system permease protein
MNAALFEKSFREARWLLLGSVAVAFGFLWLYVWMVSQIPLKDYGGIVALLPARTIKLMPIPVEQLVTYHGRVAMSYADPVILIVMGAWSIARGSDAVSGELGRGTLEMLLSQPVSRGAVLAANACVTLLGCALIALAAWLGTTVGLRVVTLDVELSPGQYGFAAANVFFLGVFLAGATTAVSAADRYRWRTIGLVCGVFVLEKIVETVCLTVERLNWLRYFTFFTLFKPPRFVTDPDHARELFFEFNGLFLVLGIAAYAIATMIFLRRDLPAPL